MIDRHNVTVFSCLFHCSEYAWVMIKPMKPILFLDFDRTLFDTDKFYEWLGEKRFERILSITGGRLPPPDFSSYVFADAISFLKKIKPHYRAVILTYSLNTILQKMKIKGSGLLPYVHDVIVTQRGKGEQAKDYLEHIGLLKGHHFFIDDAPINIEEMKQSNLHVTSIRIERTPIAKEDMKGITVAPDAVIKDLAGAEKFLEI